MLILLRLITEHTDPTMPHRGNERMFRRKKDHCDGTEVGGEAASAGDAADILHVRKWKAAREDKGGGRRSGRPRP